MAWTVVLGCSGNRETVTSQSRSNWVNADPSAITAAELEPDAKISPGTYLAAGRLHEMQGSYQKAVEQYLLTLKEDPKHVGAMNRLAMVYARMGKFDKAQEALQKAVKLKPDVALLRNNLGYAYLCQLDWENAENELQQALDLNPRFHRARVNLAIALARQDRLDDALDEFRVVVPEPDALYNLGLVLRGMQRYDDAAHAFELALEKDQQFLAAQKQLEDMTSRSNGDARKSVRKGPQSWGELASARKAAKAKTASAEPVVAKPVVVAAAKPVTPQVIPTADPVVEEVVEVATPAAEEVIVDVQPEVVTPKVEVIESAPEPAVTETITKAPVMEEAVAVAVAPITREESNVTNVTEAVPSAVAEIPEDVDLVAGAAQLENEAPSVVRLQSAVSADVAPLLIALSENVGHAKANGYQVAIDPAGVNPNAVKFATILPTTEPVVQVAALTGTVESADANEEADATAAEEIPLAVPVEVEPVVEETKTDDNAEEQIPEAVEVTDPEELLPVADTGEFEFTPGKVDVHNP